MESTALLEGLADVLIADTENWLKVRQELAAFRDPPPKLVKAAEYARARFVSSFRCMAEVIPYKPRIESGL